MYSLDINDTIFFIESLLHEELFYQIDTGSTCLAAGNKLDHQKILVEIFTLIASECSPCHQLSRISAFTYDEHNSGL